MGSNTSFYDEGGASYPDTVPPGPADAPTSPNLTVTSTSFYANTGYVAPPTYVPTYFLLGF